MATTEHLVAGGAPAQSPAGPRLARLLRHLALAVAGIAVALLLFGVWGDGERAELWSHLLGLLPRVLANSLGLCLAVSATAGALGVALAWLTATTEFPGRRFFEWALLLPLTLPVYVTAFVAVGALDYAGPVATWLRQSQGIHLPPIRSFGGAVLVLALAYYPYVYLLARDAFRSQAGRALESARVLGEGCVGAFFRVALPMSRPWIAGGLLLVAMETLADFGAVTQFNIETFTTAIYKTWFGFFSLRGALQLAAVLALFAFLLLAAEQHWRARRRFHLGARSQQAGFRIPLHGLRGMVACLVSALVLMLAFGLPLLQLLRWAVAAAAQDLDDRFWGFLWHTLVAAAGGAVLCVAVAFGLSLLRRLHARAWTAQMWRVANLGYAVPGVVLAVVLYAPVGWLDDHLIDFARRAAGLELRQVLAGSVAILLVAYMVRFTALGLNAVGSALERLPASVEEAARSLGAGGLAMLFRVHLPVLRGAVLGALAMVFVELVREMPITLLLRPFGWDTLAVRVFELTAEGEYRRAALPALMLAAVGTVPVWSLVRGGARKS